MSDKIVLHDLRNGEQTCATLNCTEACCSHENDGGTDHCCTKEEYEMHLNPYSDFQANNGENASDFKPYGYLDPNNNYISNNNQQENIQFDARGWLHLNLVASLLAVGITAAVLLVAVYCAIKYRQKYMRYQRSNIVVRHAVGRDGLVIETPTANVPLTSRELPGKNQPQLATISEKQPLPQSSRDQEAEVSSTNTPPAYNELYTKDSNNENNTSASTSSDQKFNSSNKL